jgi:hypothetical protein
MSANPVSAYANPMVANGVRAHVASVNVNLAVSFAITAASAALAYPVAQYSVPQSPAIRAAIVAVLLAPCLLISSYIRRHNKSLIDTGALSTARALLIGYAGLIGLATDVGFAAPSFTSVAGVYAVAAVAFGAASMWGYGVKRELPAWVTAVIENLIVAEIVILTGIVAAFAMEVFWPNGIGYLKYAVGLQPNAPDDAGAQWASSFFLVTYFGLTLVFYMRIIVRTYDPAWDHNLNSIPKGLLGALALLPGSIGALTSLLTPVISVARLARYVPLTPPDGESAQRLVGVLAAFALYSSILVPLVFVLILYLVAWGSA